MENSIFFFSSKSELVENHKNNVSTSSGRVKFWRVCFFSSNLLQTGARKKLLAVRMHFL